MLEAVPRDIDDPRRAVDGDRARPTRTPAAPTRPPAGPTPGYTGIRGPPQLRLLPAERSTSSTASATSCTSASTTCSPGPCGAATRAALPAEARRGPEPGDGRRAPRPTAPSIRRGPIPASAWLGPNQPGITAGHQEEDLGIGRYPGAVCPEGSTDLDVCDPGNPNAEFPARRSRGPRRAAARAGPARAAIEPGATPTAAGGPGRPRRCRGCHRAPRRSRTSSTSCSTCRARRSRTWPRWQRRQGRQRRRRQRRRRRRRRRRRPRRLGQGATRRRRTSSTSCLAMRRSAAPEPALAASPTMVGAVTTLIVIVAVFLAYNANNGPAVRARLPVSVDVPNAARLGNNNEVRIGGTRVGDGRVDRAGRQRVRAAERRRRATDGRDDIAGDRRAPEPEARQGRRAASAGLGLPRALPLDLRPQVPRDRARHRARRPGGLRLRRPQRHVRGPGVRRLRPAGRPRDVQRDDPRAGEGRLLPAADRVRRDQQHVRHDDPRGAAART